MYHASLCAVAAHLSVEDAHLVSNDDKSNKSVARPIGSFSNASAAHSLDRYLSASSHLHSLVANSCVIIHKLSTRFVTHLDTALAVARVDAGTFAII